MASFFLLLDSGMMSVYSKNQMKLKCQFWILDLFDLLERIRQDFVLSTFWAPQPLNFLQTTKNTSLNAVGGNSLGNNVLFTSIKIVLMRSDLVPVNIALFWHFFGLFKLCENQCIHMRLEFVVGHFLDWFLQKLKAFKYDITKLVRE